MSSNDPPSPREDRAQDVRVLQVLLRVRRSRRRPRPRRHRPRSRSRSGPKTKLESGRGQHSHSTEPSRRSALYEQLPMMPRPCVMIRLFGRARRLSTSRDYGRKEEAGPSRGQHGLVIAQQPPSGPASRSRATVRASSAASGGLVGGAPGRARRRDWVGWPGCVVPAALEAEAWRARLATDELFPVFLTADEEEDFYGRVCNDTLWPLFHYFPDRLRITPEAWARYVEVNERFADTIVEHCEPGRPGVGARLPSDARPGDAAPAARRRSRSGSSCTSRSRRPRSIGCFPRASSSCAGVLGADYIGFQTGDYARHFRSSCLRDARDRLRARLARARRPAGRDRRRSDRHRRRAASARCSPTRRPRGCYAELERAVRGAAARPRRRAARLHEGDPAEAARLRALPRAGSGARADDDDDPGARAVAAREPGVPGAAGRDRAPHRSHQRPLRRSPASRPSSTCTATSPSPRSSPSTGART